MNNMINNDRDKKRYKISNEVISEYVDGSNNPSSNAWWKSVIYYGMLALICVMSFLVAKYIVRSRIDNEKIPIDTSERL